ncbi:MAG: hypothetical protein ABIK62_06475, partial [candidate division WOR-3 bacterium]
MSFLRTTGISLLGVALFVSIAAAFAKYDMGPAYSFTPEPEPNATLITLANGLCFDTREGEPPLADRFRLDEPEDRPITRIIQFRGPIRPEWRAELERLGVKSFGYLPRYAVLARLGPDQSDRVRELPMVRWVGIFQPAYKLEAQLLNARGPKQVEIALMPDEEPAPVEALVARLGGSVQATVHSPLGTTLTVRIDGDRIPDLARLQAVAWIQQSNPAQGFNRNGQWVIQTGRRATAPPDTSTVARRVWQQGVRGQRIVLGLTDTGLNITGPGHNMFRDSILRPTP